MTCIGDKIISKPVGKSFEVELDREEFKVYILKGKKKISLSFDKFYKSVNFYARLKTVKDVKQAVSVAKEKFGLDFC